jgi:hypothetical protein
LKPSEFEIIKRLRFGQARESELIEIFEQNLDNYRVQFHLIQHPRFPVKMAMNIIPHLFSRDIIRVIKNRRTNPFIRKKAELEFKSRYQRLPRGEKISHLKISPTQLMENFLDESDEQALAVIFANRECTEELVLKFLNRKQHKHVIYNVLASTHWPKRPAVADAISRDSQAPIRILLDIIPVLNLEQLRTLFERATTHEIVKENILDYLKTRQA